MAKPYEIRTTAMTVAPAGDTTYSEMATTIAIADEAAGEFVEVSQTPSDRLKQIVAIDPDEWPTLRRAIDQMIAACAVTEKK